MAVYFTKHYSEFQILIFTPYQSEGWFFFSPKKLSWGVNFCCLLPVAKTKKSRMVSQRSRLPRLLRRFSLPSWRPSSQWRTTTKSKPGAATSIRCCQTRMDPALSTRFTSSRGCFRSVGCQCVVGWLKASPPACKTVLPLRDCKSCKVMAATSLRN